MKPRDDTNPNQGLYPNQGLGYHPYQYGQQNKVTNEEKPRVRNRFNPILSLVEVAMSELKNIVDANGKVVTDNGCPRKAPNMIDNVTQNEYEDNSVGTKRKTKQNL